MPNPHRVDISHIFDRVELVLYSVVNLHRESTSRAFLRTIETSRTKSRAFFATRVKSLCVSYDVYNDRTAKIISACRGVTSLTFWVASVDAACPALATLPCHDIASALDHLRPTKLSVLLHGLLQSPYPRFQSSFFEKITHLSVINTWEDWATWDGFELLPSLTHLSFDVHVGPRSLDEGTTLLISHVISNILLRCPRLRVCILLFIFDPHPFCTASTIFTGMSTPDPRLVFFGDSAPFLDREAHSRREDDIWKLAERIVKRQSSSSSSFSPPLPLLVVKLSHQIILLLVSNDGTRICSLFGVRSDIYHQGWSVLGPAGFEPA
jgi:hypothetical protein